MARTGSMRPTRGGEADADPRTRFEDALSGELFARLPEDDVARDTLIRRHRALAVGIARRYAGHGEEIEDLVQVATIGLIKAIDGFDPSRGVRFSTYAGVTISGELKRHFRDRTWSMSVPRGAKEAALRTRSVLEDSAQDLGRMPTVQELTDRSSLSEGKVREGLEALASYKAFPLEEAFNEDDDAGRSREPGDEEEGLELAEEWAELGPHVQRLPERERRILTLRYQEDLTQAEIGRLEGMSQMHVCRILQRVEGDLRDAVAS